MQVIIQKRKVSWSTHLHTEDKSQKGEKLRPLGDDTFVASSLLQLSLNIFKHSKKKTHLKPNCKKKANPLKYTLSVVWSILLRLKEVKLFSFLGFWAEQRAENECVKFAGGSFERPWPSATRKESYCKHTEVNAFLIISHVSCTTEWDSWETGYRRIHRVGFSSRVFHFEGLLGVLWAIKQSLF